MLGNAQLTRENLGTLRDVLGQYVGTQMDATTQARVARELTTRFGQTVTASEVPSLVRVAERVGAQDARRASVDKQLGGTLSASSTRDDRRSRWNDKGPLALLMRVTSSTFTTETLTSAVMRTAALGDMARAALAGTAKAAKLGLAAALVLGTLGGAVSTATYAQGLGTAQTQVTAERAQSLEEAAANLKPGQHVYVVGNFDRAHNLDGLEGYLRQYAPYVTVIAVERADRTRDEVTTFANTWLTKSPIVRSHRAANGERNGVIIVVSYGNSERPNQRTFAYAAEKYYESRYFGTSAQVEGAFKRPGQTATIDARVRSVVSYINGGVVRPVAGPVAMPTAAVEGPSAETVVLGGIGALAAGLALLAGFAAMRRRSATKESQRLITEVEQKIGARLTNLAAQIDRARKEVNDDPKILTERFAAESDKDADQMVAEIVGSGVDLGALRFVLAEAKALVAKDTARRSATKFLASKDLREAVATLTNRDIQLAPRPEIAVSFLATVGSPQWLVAVQDGLKSFAPFTASCDKLLKSLDDRVALIDHSTHELATALANGGSFKELDDQKAALVALVRGLDKKAPDGQFRVQLTPITKAIDASLEAARAAWESNPVGAVKSVGGKATRMLQETTALTNAGIEARDVMLPALAAAKEKLAATQVETGWIDTAVAALSRNVTMIAAAIAAEKSAKADIDSLTAGMASLTRRVENALAQNERRINTVPGKLTGSENGLANARADLAKKLRIVPDRVLREDGFDPSARLAEASSWVTNSKPALDTGDIAAATSALDEAETRIKEANDLVGEAYSTFDNYESNRRAFSEELRILDPALADHLGLAGELRRTYAYHVVRDLDGIDTAMADAYRAGSAAVRSAAEHFRAGALIAASRAFAAADESFRTVRRHMETIGRVSEQLADADRANSDAAQAAVQAYTIAAQLASQGVTSSTMSMLNGANSAVMIAAASMNANGRDPDAIARAIASAHVMVTSAASAVTVDLTPPPPPEPVRTTTIVTDGGDTDRTVEVAQDSAIDSDPAPEATSSEF